MALTDEQRSVVADRFAAQRVTRQVRRALVTLSRKRLGAVGLVLVLLAILAALTASWVAPSDPELVRQDHMLERPSARFWFGTDLLGRDIFSRVLHGSRISLFVGFLAMAVGTTFGAITGIISAYFRGATDMIYQRFIDALGALPPLLLALGIMAALGQSVLNVVAALAISAIPRTTRILRSQALSVAATQYVDAARAIGAGHLRIIFRHVAPNCIGTYLVVATAQLGWSIVGEASLSFLGVGSPSTVISWGAMLSADQQQYFAMAPWLGIFPGTALTLVVFGINVFGDTLRDILDPRLRGAH